MKKHNNIMWINNYWIIVVIPRFQTKSGVHSNVKASDTNKNILL